MPTQEAIVNTILPQPVEKPIPVRTVMTKAPNKPSITDQADSLRKQVTEESVPQAESVKLSPQLSALARKEQAYRQREQALKVREKELESKLSQAEQYSQLKTKLDSKDYSEAEKLGLNYEEYTKYLLNKQQGEDPTQQKLSALEEEIQSLKKGREESAAREYDETVAEYKKEIAQVIGSNPEFSSVKELKREDAVLQLILDSWEEDETEVTIEQASKDIEEYLVMEAKKMTSLSKLKPAQVEEAPKRLPPPRAGSRTLNQTMAAAGTTAKPYKSLQFLPESERYAEARRRVLERRQQ